MRKALATLALMALAGTADAHTFHYACKSGEVAMRSPWTPTGASSS